MPRARRAIGSDMRHGEPISTYDVQFCTNIIYNEKESVFLIVERKEWVPRVR